MPRARPDSNATIAVGGGLRASAVKAGYAPTPYRSYAWRGVLRDASGKVVRSCPHANHPRFEAINCAARHARGVVNQHEPKPPWRRVSPKLAIWTVVVVALGVFTFWPRPAPHVVPTTPTTEFTQLPSAIYGPSARCSDGTLSYSRHHQGTCSWHGGVSSWLDPGQPKLVCALPQMTLERDGLCHDK